MGARDAGAPWAATSGGGLVAAFSTVSAAERRLQQVTRLDRLVSSIEEQLDVAKEFRYRDGSGVLQVVKRLGQSARKDKALARKPDRITKDLSRVQS